MIVDCQMMTTGSAHLHTHGGQMLQNRASARDGQQLYSALKVPVLLAILGAHWEALSGMIGKAMSLWRLMCVT